MARPVFISTPSAPHHSGRMFAESMSIAVPEGLQARNRRISAALQKPFPPIDAHDRKETPQWDKLSTWSLVCEEVLDTEPDPGLLSSIMGNSSAEVTPTRTFKTCAISPGSQPDG